MGSTINNQSKVAVPYNFRALNFALLLVLLLGLWVLGLFIGSKSLASSLIWQHLSNISLFIDKNSDNYDIILTLRLNRLLVGSLVGAALGLAGALAQGLFRNPLADPGLLGLNSGASLLIIIGPFIPILCYLSNFALAFIGASFIIIIFAVITQKRANLSARQMLLLGAALNAFLLAFIKFIVLLHPDILDIYRQWTAGALTLLSAKEVLWICPYIIIGFAIAFYLAAPLNMINFGCSLVQIWGINIKQINFLTLITINMLVAAANAMAGPISFIGLAAPHLARLCVGNDFRWVLPYSMVIGAELLIIADHIGRLILSPQDVVVGIITPILGAPLLYWAAKKSKYRLNF